MDFSKTPMEISGNLRSSSFLDLIRATIFPCWVLLFYIYRFMALWFERDRRFFLFFLVDSNIFDFSRILEIYFSDFFPSCYLFFYSPANLQNNLNVKKKTCVIWQLRDNCWQFKISNWLTAVRRSLLCLYQNFLQIYQSILKNIYFNQLLE